MWLRAIAACLVIVADMSEVLSPGRLHMSKQATSNVSHEAQQQQVLTCMLSKTCVGMSFAKLYKQ